MFDGDPSVAQALAGGALERLGWYRFHFADGRWEWSPEVEQVPGYRLGTVQGETRDVVVICERIYDDTRKIIGTQGFYINPTQQIGHAVQRSAKLSARLVKRGLPRTSVSAPPELPGMPDD